MKTPIECLLDLEQMVRDTGRVQTYVSFRTRVDCEWRKGRLYWYVGGRAASRESAIQAIEDARRDPDHPQNWRAANLPA